MAMKEYSAFPKSPALLDPHHQIVYCHILDTRWGWGGGLTPLERCSQCILQPQLTRQRFFSLFWNVLFCLYCFIQSRYLFSLPSFARNFWFISSISFVLIVVLLFSFRPYLFQSSSSVLSFFLITIIFIIIILLCKFLTLALADGLSVESKWRQASSGLQYSS